LGLKWLIKNKLNFFFSYRISEERFWRNYFYRVSLIKQSTQLTSLAAAGMNQSFILPLVVSLFWKQAWDNEKNLGLRQESNP